MAEHNNNYNTNAFPWNDDLDDLVDIIIGWDIELSLGDVELNAFQCYLQFNQYSQPSYYHKKLNDIKLLKEFANGGSDGLQLLSLHNQLAAKVTINDKDSIHPQIVFNIAYKEHQPRQSRSNQDTFDID